MKNKLGKGIGCSAHNCIKTIMYQLKFNLDKLN